MAPTSHTKIEKILGNHPTIGLDPSAPIGSKKGLSLPWSCAFWASRPSQQCSGQSPKPPSCHSCRSTCTCLSWNCLASPQEDTTKSVQWPPCEQVAFGPFNRFFEVQLELPVAKSQTSTIINQLAQPAAGTRSLWKFDVEDDPLFPHPDPRSLPFPTPRSQRRLMTGVRSWKKVAAMVMASSETPRRTKSSSFLGPQNKAVGFQNGQSYHLGGHV